MKKRLALLLAFLCLAQFAPLLPALASESSVSSLKAVAYGATQVKVSWSGDAQTYYVNYGVVGGTFTYYDTVYDTSCIISVAPETQYEIYVEPDGGVASSPVYVMTPKPDSNREYHYRYQKCALYYVSADSHTDFWKDNSRTKFETIQSPYLMSAGELRNFYLTIDFTLSSSNADKDMNYVIVLSAPHLVDRYVTSSSVSIPANWTSLAHVFSINDLLQTHAQFNDDFAPGKYYVSLYFNGWLGGQTSFAVK